MSSGIVVVIPAFNAEPFIRATLASVASQTRLPAEVVVIDDGSTDQTVPLASEWSERLPLQVVTSAHHGPAAARREGIRLSGAPLLTLLDADDVLLPNHLERLLRVYEAHGGVATANGLRWHPDHVGRLVTTGQRLPVPPVAAQPKAILRKNFVFICSLFSRLDYERVAGFRDGFSGAEDWDLWIQLIRSGLGIHASAEPTCLYRINQHSLTSNPGVYEQYLAVLAQAEWETIEAGERQVIRQSIRRCRSRLHLVRALSAAGNGRVADARREAVHALHGPPSVASQAAAVAVAPRAAARLGGRLARMRWG